MAKADRLDEMIIGRDDGFLGLLSNAGEILGRDELGLAAGRQLFN